MKKKLVFFTLSLLFFSGYAMTNDHSNASPSSSPTVILFDRTTQLLKEKRLLLSTEPSGEELVAHQREWQALKQRAFTEKNPLVYLIASEQHQKMAFAIDLNQRK